jgi:hypothetical protein
MKQSCAIKQFNQLNESKENSHMGLQTGLHDQKNNVQLQAN